MKNIYRVKHRGRACPADVDFTNISDYSASTLWARGGSKWSDDLGYGNPDGKHTCSSLCIGLGNEAIEVEIVDFGSKAMQEPRSLRPVYDP